MPNDMRVIPVRLRPEGEKLAFPFRQFLDDGIVINFGSDAPGDEGVIFLDILNSCLMHP